MVSSISASRPQPVTQPDNSQQRQLEIQAEQRQQEAVDKARQAQLAQQQQSNERNKADADRRAGRNVDVTV